MKRSFDCRGEKKCAKRSFLDLKNRRSRACASGAYSPYVRMAHERDRRFLWLKSDGNSPTLTEPRAHKPTIHAFRDRVLPKLHENFLHVFPEPIKSLSVPEGDAPTRAIQKRRKRRTCPSEARGIKHNSAVKSRGTRDERAGASPNGGPRKFHQSYNLSA